MLYAWAYIHYATRRAEDMEDMENSLKSSQEDDVR